MAEYISRASLMGKLTAGEAQTAMREMDGSQAYSFFLNLLNSEPAADVVKRERGEWVSVEERLPENFHPVLCWYEYFRYGDWNCMVQDYGIGYCIHGCWGGEVSNGRNCKVLAWTPLPEPPEGGAEG